ncbi:Imm52 family immunity protein [Burkholderia pyrrocinia]|uniref:Imm52 family immunity protein n=1 Tax=Burkholderia pyrrocinia TaxID=60550 RepID=UPI001FC89D52|nr:Imm52 family immunity protein [Burkholderia pyrrocinia]
MKIESIIKAGGIAPTNFALTFGKVGAVIDVMATGDSSAARSNWRLKGETLEEAQQSAVYAADGSPNTATLSELDSEYQGKDSAVFGIWLNADRDDVGGSIEVMACGGDFPDTVTVGARGAFLDSKELLVSIVTQMALEFSPAVITAAPDGYEEKQAFDDRPGVGWMLYLPVELTTQQVPEAQELIPVLSADRKNRLGTILVSIKDEVFSVDNEEHLTVAHNIEVRLISMDLLPLLSEIS